MTINPDMLKAETVPPLASKTATIELLTEVPDVAVSRFAVGKLQIRKEIRTKTIQLPITLQQEVLVIDHVPSSQLAQPLPNTTLSSQNVENNSDWNAWVKIDPAQPDTNAKILLNGQPHSLNGESLEIVISQEFAHVQIQTQVAETVRIATTTESHVETLPVTVRHEELLTQHIDYDTPQLIATQTLSEKEVHFSPLNTADSVKK